MPFQRTDRISEEVRVAVDKIIREELRDTRVTGTYSVTSAAVTRDLRHATIRVSVLEQHLRRPMIDALKGAAGFVRKRLSQEMNLRYTPEIAFVLDENIEYGAHIASVLKDILPPDEAASDAQGEQNTDSGEVS